MGSAELAVEVVYSPAAGQVECVALRLPPGATVADAIAASGLAARWPECGGLDAGLWGRRAGRDARLSDGDRVEIYRPLRVDPKQARRQRARRAQAPQR